MSSSRARAFALLPGASGCALTPGRALPYRKNRAQAAG